MLTQFFAEKRAALDAHLLAVANTAPTPPQLRDAHRATLVSPGKRVRGLLTLASAETFGVRSEKVLDAAAAIEMIHASSLILDDLPSMDNAEMRRGAPTLHRRFGEDIAILVAVGLLNQSYELLIRNHAALSPRRWKPDTFLHRVTAAVGWDGSIGGQAVDLHSDAAQLDFATLEYIHSRKTGALFVASAAVGAMLANADAADVFALDAYAKNLGLAFQITDDILDVTATAEQLGKDTHKDEGHLTFVKLAGVEGARELNSELIDTALHAIDRFRSAGENLRALAEMLRDRTK